MKARIEKNISDMRNDLYRLIEIRDALSEVILEVSQRLDVLVVEYTKQAEKEKGV
ncbi:MAG: hypothetical protein UY72_C0051G0006 [Candidatus Uhrbacteria bacterium GW2011_GWD2_52_7]|uniref:Spo0E like sporulation regulatory protein n=1 Tax=Candidatus Uhrbacteria bacterium GW2011_GWD2_52_7 TaxID=1618989 RepID=A0A0G1ZMH7_9BACT|nr:MAG: hypothetical protein UY72_C0051G0006 [Candidatus Uhrbacteria bacterium GW2011_GWD2_52_7]